MSESDYQTKVELFLRDCIRYPTTKPDDDVEMNYKEFLDKLETETQDYPKTISGSIEYYFSAIRYLAYQNWLKYLGYVDNKDWFEVISDNLDKSNSYVDIEMLSKDIVGIRYSDDYSIRSMESSSGGSDFHICNENNRFENISRQTLVQIAANILYDKITTEVKAIELYLALRK